jgi:hypothetical protein
VFVRDFEPPQISCPKGVDTEADPGQCSRSNVTFVATASDNCQNVTVACVPPSGSTFPVGNTTVLCYAIDGSANSNSCSFIVTIRDLEAPKIICPSNMCVMGYAPTGAVVNYLAPQVSDNCGSVSVSCVPPSGVLFPLGSTIVTCVATDMGQNASSCNFEIRVAQPCPKLDISLRENPQIPGSYEIWICWTGSPNSICALQYTDSLNTPINWQPWLGPIINQSGKDCVRITNPSGMRFFRLYGNCSYIGTP